VISGYIPGSMNLDSILVPKRAEKGPKNPEEPDRFRSIAKKPPNKFSPNCRPLMLSLRLA
jgi:hypothetical protein